MKHYRSTVALFLIVAFVAGYAYFIEYKGKAEKQEAEIEAKKIIPFSLEEVTEFSLKNATTEYLFKKEKDGNSVKWHMEKPISDIANYAAVQGFLSQFGQEGYEEVAAEGLNIDFGIYGLNEKDPAQKISEITFTKKTKDDEQVLLIEVGNAAALGGKKYLRLNKQDKVLIAGFLWENQLQKNLSDLREKNFVSPDFSISKIEIKNKENLSFEQKDNKWILNQLKTNDPDPVAIDDIYYQIKNLRATQIFKEGKHIQDLSSLGLNDPEIKIHLYAPEKEGKVKIIEILFSKNMSGQVYALSNERNVIFSLNPPAVNVFRKGVDDFRDKKKPLSFDLTRVDQIDYRSDLASFKLKKEENSWTSVENLQGKQIDNTKVVDILSKLSMMKVKKYFDQGVAYQKSGLVELKLKSSSGEEVLDLKWSPRPIEDVFVAKSNLSDKTFGLSLQDVGSLPFQAVVIDPPKEIKNETKAPEKEIE